MKHKIVFGIAAAAVLAAAGFGVYKTAQLQKYKRELSPLKSSFTVTAHTGSMGTKENSLASIETGAQNADTVEFDVNFSADGSAVLSHDKPKGGEVTLEEAFAALAKTQGVTANVDIKSTQNLPEIQFLAEKCGVSERIFLTGVSEQWVSAVKKGCPKIRYFLNMSVDRKKCRDSAYLESLIATVKESGAVGINFHYGAASKELVDAFHESGLLVSVWTVDKRTDMYRILSYCPDNITTKKPDRLLKIIEENSCKN